MPSKYKISPLRVTLLAASVALALWTPNAPLMATLVLWLAVGWLLVTALLLDFSHRRSRGLPWQLLAGTLLLALIAVAPERHLLLIWAWGAVFMLPQPRWVAMYNVCAALLTCLIIKPLLTLPAWCLLIATLCILCLLAMARTYLLVHLSGTMRQRLRLIPGLNLWAGEQLLRDLTKEQTRSEREAIHAEVLIIHLRLHQLWPAAHKLCSLLYSFENVYRLNATTLATLMLARTPREAAHRRQLLCAALPEHTVCQPLPLIELELEALTLEALAQMGKQRPSVIT